MKIVTTLLVLASALAVASVRAQVVLQDFSSTVGSNTVFHGTWEVTGTGASGSPNPNFVQGSGVFDFTGTTGIVPTNAASSFVEFFNTPQVSIGANTSLSVSAQTLATDVATSFTVTLFDGAAKTAFSTFNTIDFVTGSYTTITAPLTIQSGFNAATIDSMIISGNQPGGTAQFNVSFDNISAVSAIPEPATCAALGGVFVLGFAVWRRRASISA